jgi:hypothetical protein
MSSVAKIINFIFIRPLHKSKFLALLLESHSINNSLLMNNNVRWLSRGKALERFVDTFERLRILFIK